MDAGRKLLLKLFNSWQNNPDSQKRKSLPITKNKAQEYYETIDHEDKELLHAYLKNAESAGAIQLVWGKHYDSHLLQKIWLIDGSSLGRFLDVPLARNLAKQAEQDIIAQIPQNQKLTPLLSKILSAWDKNKSAYRIDPGKCEEVIVLLRAIDAVLSERQTGLDLRTFSAREFGDSKIMERIKDRFTRAWNDLHQTAYTSQELYEILGLIKFLSPIYIKGPVSINMGKQWINLCNLPSYLGIPPVNINGLIPEGRPDYVITIENLASYNRYCKEISDNGIVIYSAGFLSPVIASFIQNLDSILSPDIPFYHWGDIDAGGLNIARHIQSQLPKRFLKLHLMNVDVLQEFGKKVPQIGKTLSNGHPSRNEEIENLVKFILKCSPARALEQENLDPCSPKH